jgi:hypothetical protein
MYTYEEAFSKGIVTLSLEDFRKATAERKERAAKPETWPEVKIDHHGLIWNTDGKVLVNLFKCAHHVMRVNEWTHSKEYRKIQKTGYYGI